MDVPALPHDALVQPTRARLFGLLTELRRPAGTEELAARLRMHPNGVRVHLERLREAGLVVREITGQARGRPRAMWAIATGARPGGDAPSGYAQLSRWLARAINPTSAGVRGVETTGLEIGRELAPADERGAEEKLHGVLAALGFEPWREATPDGELTYRLCNCPYREAVRANAPVVCALHRGIVKGLLDVLAPTTELSGFVPHDPDQAGCLIQLRGGLADEGIQRLREPASP
jgi:predicted ArsR family transcriptional regulator